MRNNEAIKKSLNIIQCLYLLLKDTNKWKSAGISGLLGKELTKETINNARISCNKFIGSTKNSHNHQVMQKIISEIEKISRVMEQDGKAQADYKEGSLGDSKLTLRDLADIKESHLTILSICQLFRLKVFLTEAVADTSKLSLRPLFEAQICFSRIKNYIYVEERKKGDNTLTQLSNLIAHANGEISKIKKQELNTEPYFTLPPVALFNKIHKELKLTCGNTTRLLIDYSLDPEKPFQDFSIDYYLHPETSFKDFCKEKLKPFLEYKITTRNPENAFHCWDNIVMDLCLILESFLQNENLEPKKIKYFRKFFPTSRIITAEDVGKICFESRWPTKDYYSPVRDVQRDSFEEFLIGDFDDVLDGQLGQKIFEESRSLWRQIKQIEKSEKMITCRDTINQQELYQESPFAARHKLTLFSKLHTELNLTSGDTTNLIIDYYSNPEENLKDFCIEELKRFLDHIDIYYTGPRGTFHKWNMALKELCQVINSLSEGKKLYPGFIKYFTGHFTHPRIATVKDIGTICFESNWCKEHGDDVCEQFLIKYSCDESDKQSARKFYAEFKSLWNEFKLWEQSNQSKNVPSLC